MSLSRSPLCCLARLQLQTPPQRWVRARHSLRGTCLLRRWSTACRKPSASVCVCVGVSVSLYLWVSARYRSPLCNASLFREGADVAPCCVSLFNSGFFLDNCASSVPSGCGILGSAGIFSVCMFLGVACSLLPRSDVCSPACMDFPSSVLCAECHPVFCDHPCNY